MEYLSLALLIVLTCASMLTFSKLRTPERLVVFLLLVLGLAVVVLSIKPFGAKTPVGWATVGLLLVSSMLLVVLVSVRQRRPKLQAEVKQTPVRSPVTSNTLVHYGELTKLAFNPWDDGVDYAETIEPVDLLQTSSPITDEFSSLTDEDAASDPAQPQSYDSVDDQTMRTALSIVRRDAES